MLNANTLHCTSYDRSQPLFIVKLLFNRVTRLAMAIRDHHISKCRSFVGLRSNCNRLNATSKFSKPSPCGEDIAIFTLESLNFESFGFMV